MTTRQQVRFDTIWSKPPISLNDRQHWRIKAAHTKQVREAARILAIAAHLPRNLDHVTIQLHYRPRDRRRRDADNLVGTLKAICDGLVDFGLVADDTPDLMTKHMPRIDEPIAGLPGLIWLDIHWEEA